MKLLIPLFSAAVLVAATGCQTNTKQTINYPAPRPDSVALNYLPGIVSSDSLDFTAAFSLDGKTFYFSRSQNRRYTILETIFDGTKWTAPKPAAFADTSFLNADPFLTSDGTVFFISNRPKNTNDTLKDFDIWMIRNENGKWGTPENIEAVNSDSSEYYVSIAGNGNLYFASNRSGGNGEHDIYVSKFINGKYTKPENLGIAVNSAKMEHDPLISADEKILIFTAIDRPDGFGEADLYYSRRNADGSWSDAKNMGSTVNTKTYEYCPNVSPDLKYFFYSSELNVKWINKDFLFSKIGLQKE